MRTSLIIYLLFAGLLLTSCGSSKRLAQREQTRRLSQQLGVKVTPKDDLRLYEATAQWLGTPYRYGGTSRNGVDCSGFVGQIYQQVYRKKLMRNTADIARKDCRKVSKGRLKAGDLVFFNTSKKKRKGINHVGLFLKDGYFVHASTSKGVMVNNLHEEYYRKSWKQGGKVK